MPSEAQIKASKKHYEANKEVVKRRAAEYKKNQIAKLKELSKFLRSVICKDCEGDYPWYIMEFDHVRGTKHRDVSVLVSRAVSVATFMAEVAKCEVVCANCHRARTYNRRNAVLEGVQE